jgi:hypothetical protein
MVLIRPYTYPQLLAAVKHKTELHETPREENGAISACRGSVYFYALNPDWLTGDDSDTKGKNAYVDGLINRDKLKIYRSVKKEGRKSKSNVNSFKRFRSL